MESSPRYERVIHSIFRQYFSILRYWATVLEDVRIRLFDLCNVYPDHRKDGCSFYLYLVGVFKGDVCTILFLKLVAVGNWKRWATNDRKLLAFNWRADRFVVKKSFALNTVSMNIFFLWIASSPRLYYQHIWCTILLLVLTGLAMAILITSFLAVGFRVAEKYVSIPCVEIRCHLEWELDSDCFKASATH